MKLSFTTMATPELDHRGAIELANHFGFRGVDIRCAKLKGEVTPDDSEERLETVGRDFRNAALAIPSVLCYNKLDSYVDDAWQQFEADLRRLLPLAERLHAQAIRIFGGKLPEAGRGVVIDRMAAVVRGVLADDEAMPAIVIQNHRGSYGIADAVRLAERINHPRFGLVFSPDHCVLMNEGGIEPVLEAISPWTKEIYIADISVDGARHDTVLPGAGVAPLAETVRFFEKQGFGGFYSFKWEKIWLPKIEEPEVALPAFVKFMQSL